MTTGVQKPTTNIDLVRQGNTALREALSEQLQKSKESIAHENHQPQQQGLGEEWSAFADLDRVSTPEELIRLARAHNMSFEQ